MVLKLLYIMHYILINSILGIHLRLHTEEKTYLCYIYDKVFQHFTPYQLIPALIIWFIQIHTGEFQYPVYIIMFIFMYRLKEHILASLSTLVIQFSCTECDFIHLTSNTSSHSCDLSDKRSAMNIEHTQIFTNKYPHLINKYIYTHTYKMKLYLLLSYTKCVFSQVKWNTGKYNDVTMGKNSATLYITKWS